MLYFDQPFNDIQTELPSDVQITDVSNPNDLTRKQRRQLRNAKLKDLKKQYNLDKAQIKEDYKNNNLTTDGTDETEELGWWKKNFGATKEGQNAMREKAAALGMEYAPVAAEFAQSYINEDTYYGDDYEKFKEKYSSKLKSIPVFGTAFSLYELGADSLMKAFGTERTFSYDPIIKDALNGSYNFDDLDKASRMSGYTTIGQNQLYEDATLQKNILANIAQDTINRQSAASDTQSLTNQYKAKLNGGVQIQFTKQGSKLDRVKQITSNKKVSKKQQGGHITEEYIPIIISDTNNEIEENNIVDNLKFIKNIINTYAQGGQIKELVKLEKTSQKNVIPEGALHKNKHHIENTNGLTQKGIPVIDNDGEQQAEIELDEIIFTLEVTKKLEELHKIFKEGNQKEKDKAAIEAGQLLVYEILYNTDDRTGLITKCKKGGIL